MPKFNSLILLRNKTVKTIEASEPITSLSFFNDGITIAAGTPTGSIYVYNLKDFNVKQILKGHDGYEIRYISKAITHLKTGCIILSFHCKRYFNSSTKLFCFFLKRFYLIK